MANIPVEPGYIRFDGGGQPILLGSYSESAGKYFFPTRLRCPVSEQAVVDVDLSTAGTLYSWTFVRMPQMGSQKLDASGGYGVGQIDLPEGVRIQAVIAGRMGDWSIGMPMRLAPLPMGTDDHGNSLCGFQFVPADAQS